MDYAVAGLHAQGDVKFAASVKPKARNADVRSAMVENILQKRQRNGIDGRK